MHALISCGPVSSRLISRPASQLRCRARGLLPRCTLRACEQFKSAHESTCVIEKPEKCPLIYVRQCDRKTCRSLFFGRGLRAVHVDAPRVTVDPDLTLLMRSVSRPKRNLRSSCSVRTAKGTAESLTICIACGKLPHQRVG